MAPILPGIRDIEDAAERLAGLTITTPLIEHPALNEAVGGRVFLKAENLQRVGAFKIRGAYNAISRVDRAAFPGGVVACSSGNHAQGMASNKVLQTFHSVCSHHNYSRIFIFGRLRNVVKKISNTHRVLHFNTGFLHLVALFNYFLFGRFNIRFTRSNVH